MKTLCSVLQHCVVATLAVVIAGCSQNVCADFPIQLDKDRNFFTEIQFIPAESDFIPLPSNFVEINSIISTCGIHIDPSMVPGSLQSSGAVKVRGRYFLRYIPVYVTDTVYYFEVVHGRVLNAYESRF